MKKSILFSLFSFLMITAWGQSGLTSFSEDFDGSCATPGGFPGGWYRYNPLPGTVTYGEWSCSPTNGRPNSSAVPTPGMQCSDTSGGSYHLDTSYLMTPMINLGSYAPGHVYIQFDTKTSRIYLGSDITVIGRSDTSATDTAHIYFTPTPVFSNGDSTNWITHVVDLTAMETYGPFYIAFRYTSTNTTGSIWFLDNVKITNVNITLSEPEIADGKVALGIISASADAVEFSYLPPQPGNYNLELSDMLGHVVYRANLETNGARANYTITGTDLRPGMYILKMGNAHSAGFQKVMIR